MRDVSLPAFSPVSTLLPTTHYTLSPPLVYCNEGVFIMFIDKGLELYQQACRHGLSVSLSINHLNGQESFSLTTILVQIWQTCQNTGGVPEEDEDPDKMVFIPNRSEGQAQPNQLLSRPLMPLLPDCRCACFSLLLLSILVLLLSMLLLPTLPRNSPDHHHQSRIR